MFSMPLLYLYASANNCYFLPLFTARKYQGTDEG